MDCDFSIFLSQIHFGEIKEIVNLCGAHIIFFKLGGEEVYEDSFFNEHIFLISTVDPWYGDIIVYLKTLKVPTHLSRDGDDNYVT